VTVKSLFAGAALALCLITPAAAQSPAKLAPAVQPAVKHLVVFNRPGANFAKLRMDDAEHVSAIRAHQKLYLDYAKTGDLVVGGRFSGEPVLGMSVFRTGVDIAAVRKTLEDDPAVGAGFVAVEFREWTPQMGALPVRA
jgi:hypothetical protein